MKTNGYYIIYGMEIGYKSFRIFMGKYTGERPGGSPENPNDDDDGAYKETSSEQKINVWRGEDSGSHQPGLRIGSRPDEAPASVSMRSVQYRSGAHAERDSFHAKLCRSIKKRRRSINDSLFFCVFINKDNVSAVFLILRPAGDRQSAGEKTRQWIRRNEEKCCV